MKIRLPFLFILSSLLGVLLIAEPRIKPPKNSYTPKQDVELGLEAAKEVRQQLPLMSDDAVTSFVDDIGKRLVRAIPPELQHAEFNYTFETVNVSDINAFALPGGPMFVNRGMIEAANSEGEVAGVMAHEISHVVLRHGTAQASKTNKGQIIGVAGAILGAILGGRTGDIVAQGTQFGVGLTFLRFSRDFEKQADLEGTQIMSLAGYDAREMASLFKTIEKEGSQGPQWLSDHPNPGNRAEYIVKEAQSLPPAAPLQNAGAFERVRARLKGLPKAPTSEEAAKNRTGGTTRGPDTPPAGRVPPPSSRYTQYTEGDVFRVTVPANWKEIGNGNSVTFAPDGAVGQVGGQGVFTHGVQIGIAGNENHDLRTATDQLISSLLEGNPKMTRPSIYRAAMVDGFRGIETEVGNVSEATGNREAIRIVTTLINSRTLFYVIAVAPEDELADYDRAFQRVVTSIRITR